MSFVSVCKNVIGRNNKKNWVDPDPTIRIGKTRSGSAVDRAHSVGIVDKDGIIVAKLVATQDGKPVIKCGAKVALITEYDVKVLE
tara:strand:+ start:204 stop:458 length:255 start_codon:yes stop_codon:yes gene_type:complete